MIHRLPQKALLAALAVTALSGCASYSARPLPVSPDLATALPALSVAPNLPVLPTIRFSRIDPETGLTESQVAGLSVLADPELKVLRAKIGVAQARALAAGLPPDPLLTLSTAQVLSTRPGLSNPLVLSIGEDIGRLITLGDARQAAAEHLRNADLCPQRLEFRIGKDRQFRNLRFGQTGFRVDAREPDSGHHRQVRCHRQRGQCRRQVG